MSVFNTKTVVIAEFDPVLGVMSPTVRGSRTVMVRVAGDEVNGGLGTRGWAMSFTRARILRTAKKSPYHTALVS